MINLFLLLLLLIAFAMLFGQGIWSNAITLLNLLMAALLATCWFEPLADFLDSKEGSLTYFWDFTALWGLFALFFVIFRAASDSLSKTQVRFKQIVDRVGGGILALWSSWVLVCFTAMSLHLAPLPRNGFMDSFQPNPESRLMFGLAPDEQWLGFVQKVSAGSWSTAPPSGVEGENGANLFDPNGEFVFKYGERRARLEQAPGVRVYRDP